MNRDPIEWLSNEAEPRSLALAAIALLVLGVTAGFLYGLKPAWATHQDLADERLRIRAHQVGEGPQSAVEIERLRHEIAGLRDQLYGSAARIPASEIESFVVDSLDRISSEHGVSLLGITPGSSGTIWMFDELPYEVRVEGSFFSVHAWLYDVEEALRPMVVKRFALSPNRERDGVVLELRVVAYRAMNAGGA